MSPRKRNPENKSLPARWRFYHGAYFYQVPKGQEHRWDGKKQFKLGKTMVEAFREWTNRLEAPDRELSTMAALFDRYLLEVVPTKAAKSQQGNRDAIARLRPVFGHMAPAAFKPVHAYGYRDKRSKGTVSDDGTKRKGAPTAANRELEVLSHVFTKAIEWGAVERHPMIEGKFRKNSTPPRNRYVEDWEVIAALAIDSRRKRGSVRMVQAYVKLKLLTGMRRTDLLRLRMADIKPDGIHVTPNKTANSSGKSTVYEWDTAPDANGIQRKELGQMWRVVAECKAARPVDLAPFLFCTGKGESYFDDETGDANGFDSIWQRFMARVLAETTVTERFQERDLRAKCATDAESLEHARALLTHASEATTNRIYRRKAERVKPGKGVQ